MSIEGSLIMIFIVSPIIGVTVSLACNAVHKAAQDRKKRKRKSKRQCFGEARDIKVIGRNCHALGIDTKVVQNGLCGHLNKRPINAARLDGLPISERDWTHCVFCVFGEKEYCTFAGECEHRIKGGADNEQREADA